MPTTLIEEPDRAARSKPRDSTQRERPDTTTPKREPTKLHRDTASGQTSKPSSPHTLRPKSKPVRIDPQHPMISRPHTPPKKLEPAQRQSTGWFSSLVDGQPLEKSFVVFGYVVAATLVAIFGSDLILGWPFQHASTVFDVTNVICGAGLAYLSWDAYQSLP